MDSAASDLGLRCLALSHIKDTRLLWVKLYAVFNILLYFPELPPVCQTVWIQIRPDCIVGRDLGLSCFANTVKSRKSKVLGTSQSEVTGKRSTLNSTCCSNADDYTNEKQLKNLKMS